MLTHTPAYNLSQYQILCKGRIGPRVTHLPALPRQTQRSRPSNQSTTSSTRESINQSMPSRHSPGRPVRPTEMGQGVWERGGMEGSLLLMPCDPLTETSEKLRTRNDAHDYLLCGPPLSLKDGPVLWHTHTHTHTSTHNAV